MSSYELDKFYEVKRYNPSICVDYSGHTWASLEEHEHGMYISLEDYRELLAAYGLLTHMYTDRGIKELQRQVIGGNEDKND